MGTLILRFRGTITRLEFGTIAGGGNDREDVFTGIESKPFSLHLYHTNL